MRKGMLIGGLVIAIPLVLLGILAVLNRRDEIRGVGQEFVYDDFGFTVLAFRHAGTLGSGTPNGKYAIVTLRVRNHARRVPYKFRTQSALLTDSSGKEYRVDPAGQAVRDSRSPESAAREESIPAGGERTFDLVFQTPDPLESPSFRISDAGTLGDILDFIFFGRKLTMLSSSERQAQ